MRTIGAKSHFELLHLFVSTLLVNSSTICHYNGFINDLLESSISPPNTYISAGSLRSNNQSVLHNLSIESKIQTFGFNFMISGSFYD